MCLLLKRDSKLVVDRKPRLVRGIVAGSVPTEEIIEEHVPRSWPQADRHDALALLAHVRGQRLQRRETLWVGQVPVTTSNLSEKT
jgi:hypothetical protein